MKYLIALLIIFTAAIIPFALFNFYLHPPVTNSQLISPNVQDTSYQSAMTKTEPLVRWISLSNVKNSGYYEKGAAICYSAKNLVADACIDDIDPSTFMIAIDSFGAPSAYSKDQKHLFFLGVNASNVGYFQSVDGADPTAFMLIYSAAPSKSHSFAKDTQHVYLNYQVFPNADPSSFKVVTLANGTATYYSKDRSHVFFCGDICDPQIIGNAGPVTLDEAVPSSFAALAAAQNVDFGADENHVFDHGLLVQGADPQSFSLLCTNGSVYGDVCLFAKDDHHVYVLTDFVGDTALIPSADPATFHIIDSSECALDCSYVAQDKDHRYDSFGQVVN